MRFMTSSRVRTSACSRRARREDARAWTLDYPLLSASSHRLIRTSDNAMARALL
jgi:hypothetical protein